MNSSAVLGGTSRSAREVPCRVTTVYCGVSLITERAFRSTASRE